MCVSLAAAQARVTAAADPIRASLHLHTHAHQKLGIPHDAVCCPVRPVQMCEGLADGPLGPPPSDAAKSALLESSYPFCTLSAHTVMEHVVHWTQAAGARCMLALDF